MPEEASDDEQCEKCDGGGLWMCIEISPGVWHVFGPCSSDNCGGVCEDEGVCNCECHRR